MVRLVGDVVVVAALVVSTPVVVERRLTSPASCARGHFESKTPALGRGRARRPLQPADEHVAGHVADKGAQDGARGVQARRTIFSGATRQG